VLFLLLILFLWLRLRTLGLCDRDHRFLLHGLIRLDYGLLLRRSGLLRIAMLWIEIFLIWHFTSPLLVFLLLVIGELFAIVLTLIQAFNGNSRAGSGDGSVS
jgi:hypothetical protein